MTNNIKVFLADDHAVVREGLKCLVSGQSDMEVCGEAGDGQAACEGVDASRPDVLVTDVTMPVMNGIQVAQWLRDRVPGTKVVALTQHEDRGYLQQLLEAGAVGYVLKRASADDFIQAIRTVASGGVFLDPSMAAKVVNNITGKRSRKSSQERELTERETEVARLVAQGYSNKEIAATLEISVKTVETHKSRLMDKLGFRSRAEVVRYAVSRGWLQSI